MDIILDMLKTILTGGPEPLFRSITPKDPKTFNQKAYAKIANKLKPKLDFKPTGKRPGDKNAGSNDEFDGTTVGVETQIIGGTKARRGQFPWQAKIEIDGSYMCGGSLIDPSWVLTAAHCVSGFSKWNISLGMVKISRNIAGRVDLLTTQAYLHENYSDETLVNDIALLKLPEAVSLTKFIQPVRLPSVRDATKTFLKTKCIISGWGKVGNDKGTSDDLKFLKREIEDSKECVKYYGSDTVTDSTLCIKNADKQSTCQGDSGGPFVLREKDKKYTQFGLVSFGSSQSCTGFPGGFTRVSSFLGWISEKTQLAIRK
ncbi:Hypothetical predicted protein [Cloeon dipterum]|uniref:limulus clotting factor C n=1 Tax=Cloeon dipterum TaxID=197152 RepID=A0A8S1C2L1_9INSE|nr:Hypothetical predicted protein [Cloeon dipterum]